jgi:hypothetical protein
MDQEYFARYINTSGLSFQNAEINIKFLFVGQWINEIIMVSLNSELIYVINSDTQSDHACQYCVDDYEQSMENIKISLNLKKDFVNVLTLKSNKTVLFKEVVLSYSFCPSGAVFDLSSVFHSCKCISGYFRDALTKNFKCLRCPTYCLECSGSSRKACSKCKTDFLLIDGRCESKTSKFYIFSDV